MRSEKRSNGLGGEFAAGRGEAEDGEGAADEKALDEEVDLQFVTGALDLEVVMLEAEGHGGNGALAGKEVSQDAVLEIHGVSASG